MLYILYIIIIINTETKAGRIFTNACTGLQNVKLRFSPIAIIFFYSPDYSCTDITLLYVTNKNEGGLIIKGAPGEIFKMNLDTKFWDLKRSRRRREGGGRKYGSGFQILVSIKVTETVKMQYQGPIPGYSDSVSLWLDSETCTCRKKFL